jgi:flagellin
VFIGGGKDSNGVTATSNGSVSIDLSKSTVDAKSLGLEGVQASGAAGSDIGGGSTTSVAKIIADPTNQASITNNTTTFSFTGPGFADTSGTNTIKVAVNLTGVTDTGTLVTALNQAIANAGNGASQQATAFKNSNITAAINTDATGKQQLTFSSGSTAFQVQGGDQIATALLGSYSSGAVGNVANVTALAATNFSSGTTETAVKVRILGAGLNGAAADDLAVTVTSGDTLATAVSNINAAIAGKANVAATGIQAVVNGSKISFVGAAGQSFEVLTAGDEKNQLGFGSFTSAAGIAATATTFDYTSLSAAAAVSSTATDNQNIQVSINGGATIDLGNVVVGASENTALNALNTAFQANAATRAAGVVATDTGGKVKITSSSANFRLNFYGGTGDAFGYGASAAGSATSTGSTAGAYAAKASVNSSGAQESQNGTNTDVYKFTGLRNTGDSQTVTLTAVDASGNEHTLNVALTTLNANNLDQAISTINTAIAASNDSTLNQLAALKEQGASGGTTGVNGTSVGQEGLRFLSAGSGFKVSLGSSGFSGAALTGGASANVVGLADYHTGQDGGGVFSSTSNGAGSTADISNITTAQTAVAALSTAVTSLGKAQAVVGRGQNQFNYAVNLAQSQLTNLAAAESRIRDADLAAESANLTKSQILLQAGIAALAQANSAPQQVLTLLRG